MKVATMIEGWQKTPHSEEWILRAIEAAKGKHINYADKILLGWEQEGYPPERKAPPPSQPRQTRAQSDFQKAMQALQQYANAD